MEYSFRNFNCCFVCWFALQSLVNKLVPCAWLSSGALEVWRLRLRLRLSRSSQLQSVLNAAARLIGGIPKFGHISGFIQEEQHCLPMQKRIEFKIIMLMRNCLAGQAPVYLRELCVHVLSMAGRRFLCSEIGR